MNCDCSRNIICKVKKKRERVGRFAVFLIEKVYVYMCARVCVLKSLLEIIRRS